jgi:hypothetical protein
MLEQIPFVFEPVQVKDFVLGASIALALRRGRVQAVLDKVLPTRDNDG